MTGDLDRQQEIALLSFLAEIVSKGDLEELMSYIVHNAPELLKVRRCSIYLTPEFVPLYTGKLIEDPETTPVIAKFVKNDFIVLAQTSYPEKQEYIGEIFYTSGSDLTGWVFQTGRILRLKNARDLTELRNIDPNLKASIRYMSIEPETDLREIFPILYIPLNIDSKTIGVFKLHQPYDLSGFSELEQLARRCT